jgi:plastocyanin
LAKAIVIGLALAAIAAGVIATGARGPEPREIRIVARDMTFYVDGQPEPNPTLRVCPGEIVRLVLQNEDAGMTHDFAIPGWQAATRRLEAGESATLTVTAPGRRSTESYWCRPHAAIMRGTIVVE